MLDQETASIINFLYNINPVKIYDDEIPEGFKAPAMYFPTLDIQPSTDTVSTYKYEYTWFIKIFDNPSSEAYTAAKKIVDELNKKQMLIPLINENGDFINKNLKIKRMNLRKIDEGVIQIELGWKSSYIYESKNAIKIQHFYFDTKLKGGD